MKALRSNDKADFMRKRTKWSQVPKAIADVLRGEMEA